MRHVPHRLKKARIVYKKGYVKNSNGDTVEALITLRLSAGTLINVPIGHEIATYGEEKNRADRARVLRIVEIEETEYGFITTQKKHKEATGYYRSHFKYRVGKVVRPSRPFARSRKECASGIHFFARRDDALSYSG